MKKKSIRIGNGAGFWGDNPAAPKQLADHGQLDYLTLEYLAELTLSILAYQRMKDPGRGFVTAVPQVVGELADHFKSDQPLKLVTNGGGMNPTACVVEAAKKLVAAGAGRVRLAAVAGDDLLDRIDELIDQGEAFEHFETGQPLGDLREKIVSANAYMGVAGICDALDQKADIVITGRVADASLVVGPLIHEFGWSRDNWNKLAAGTVAGHLIECGAQVTGGMYSDWTPEISLGDIGYPIAEVAEDGSMVITKPAGTGGLVCSGTVAEQLVYEIGDPRRYMTPDVVANFSNVTAEDLSEDRVAVNGAEGTPAPDRFKVSMAYRSGFATTGEIVLAGAGAIENAKVAAEAIKQKMIAAGCEPDQFAFECLGSGATLPSVETQAKNVQEVVLRMQVRDSRKEVLENFASQIPALVTSGPPGVTGYVGARPKIYPVLAYWPSTIDKNRLTATMEIRTAEEWVK
jgi:hypothetical protein